MPDCRLRGLKGSRQRPARSKTVSCKMPSLACAAPVDHLEVRDARNGSSHARTGTQDPRGAGHRRRLLAPSPACQDDGRRCTARRRARRSGPCGQAARAAPAPKHAHGDDAPARRIACNQQKIGTCRDRHHLRQRRHGDAQCGRVDRRKLRGAAEHGLRPVSRRRSQRPGPERAHALPCDHARRAAYRRILQGRRELRPAQRQHPLHGIPQGLKLRGVGVGQPRRGERRRDRGLECRGQGPLLPSAAALRILMEPLDPGRHSPCQDELRYAALVHQLRVQPRGRRLRHLLG